MYTPEQIAQVYKKHGLGKVKKGEDLSGVLTLQRGFAEVW
jgi:hypothetical protein